MALRWQVLLSFAVALGVGLLAAKLAATSRPLPETYALPEPPPSTLEPAPTPAPADQSPRDAAAGAPTPPARQGAADTDAGADVAAEPMAPVAADLVAADVVDPTLLARGPGRFVTLDLAAAGVRTLLLRDGRMDRDGDGRFAPYARLPVVARLVPDASGMLLVELLHLGIDATGAATVAHIRTASAAPREGVVSLRHGEQTIALRQAERPSDLPVAPPPAVGAAQPAPASATRALAR